MIISLPPALNFEKIRTGNYNLIWSGLTPGMGLHASGSPNTLCSNAPCLMAVPCQNGEFVNTYCLTVLVYELLVSLKQ